MILFSTAPAHIPKDHRLRSKQYVSSSSVPNEALPVLNNTLVENHTHRLPTTHTGYGNAPFPVKPSQAYPSSQTSSAAPFLAFFDENLPHSLYVSARLRFLGVSKCSRRAVDGGVGRLLVGFSSTLSDKIGSALTAGDLLFGFVGESA